MSDKLVELLNRITVSARGRKIAIVCDTHETKDAVLDALTIAEMSSADNTGVDAGARRLSEWIGCFWDGLRDGRITDRGFPQWSFDGLGHKSYQGGKDDLRDLAREIARIVNEPSLKQ